MNQERAAAYGRIVRQLEDIAPTRLQAVEVERIRTAADTLVLSEEADPVSRAALEDVEELARHLLEAGRWESVETERLMRELEGCGPALHATLQ